MVKMNGGAVRTGFDHFELFSFLDASDRKSIRRTCSSICRETATARERSHGFPADGVAIGTNGGGDLLVLLPMPDHPDTLQHGVFYWDHEANEIEQVADDFGEVRRD